MAGGGKVPSDAGKIQPSERNRTNDDASFKRAEQKFAAQNVEREQKRQSFHFQRPINAVDPRVREREEHPEQISNQGSSNDLAGRNVPPIDSPIDSGQTNDSQASYNARRQKTQAAKAEKLAETEQKDIEIKANQAEQQLAYDVAQANLNASSNIAFNVNPNVGSDANQQPIPSETGQTMPVFPEAPGIMPKSSTNGINSTSGTNSTPGGTIKAEYFSPTSEAVEGPGGSADTLVGTPGQNGGGIKVTQQGPGYREDAIVAEPPRHAENIVEQNAPASISPDVSAPKDDSYETPLESAKENMRPNFLASVFGGAKRKPAQGKTTRGGSDALRNAEKNASNLDSSFGLDAQTGENEVNSDFVNNVGSQKLENNSENQKVKSGFLKKKGPLMSIIISLLFGGGGMYMTQASLPFTVLDKLNDTFDSQDISVNKRSGVFTKLMAKNAKNIDASSGATKKNLFGKQKFSVSKKMRKRMKANNLNIITDKNNPNVGKLEFTDKNGNTKLYTPAEFENAYKNNTEIRKSYDAAAHPWKTSVSNFLDKGFQKIMNRFGLKKRALDGYDAKSDPTGEKARKGLANEVENTFEDGANNTRASGGENDDEGMLKDDPDDSDPTTPADEVEKGKSKASNISAKLSASLKKAFQVSQVVCMVPTIMTGATLIAQAYQLYQVVKIAMLFMSGVDQARAGDAASSPVNALGRSLVEQSSERRYTSKFSAESDYEEENDDYGYYEYTTHEEFESNETEARSAIQSEGMSKLFTGDPVAEADESIRSFNSENVLKGKFQEIEDEVEDNLGILGDLLDDFDTSTFLTDEALKASTFYACQVARMSLAYAMLGFDVAALVASFEAAATGWTAGTAAGAGACAATVVLAGAAPVCGVVGGIIGGLVGFFTGQAGKKALKAALKMAVSMLGSLVASWAASHVATFLVNMLKRKAVTEFFGEDLGNAIMSGSHSIMADNHRSSGGLLADKEGYIAMLIQQDAVNAEEAKSDRLARSPFDITSQNTFAGQLAATLTPVLWQSDSLLDTVGKFGSTVRNSAKVFLPTASAYNAAKQAEYAEDWTANNCENLDAIGVVGDEFCNPYIVTDFDTMFTDDSEDDEIETADNTPYKVMQDVGQSNFADDIDSTENPKIKEGSDLADYILNCSERESAFGYADENIAGRYDTQKNDVWGMIDLVSDWRDAHSGDEILDHFGWIDGSNCVIHEDLDYADALDYDDIKNFSRYMEDQRLAETMGVVEESAVSVFLDEYYEKNPKDMSQKAVLARMAGMTTETFDSVMAGIEVVDFIAHYDPTDYYPTPAVHKEDPSYTIEDWRMVEDDGVLALIYENNSSLNYYQRNFAVA